MTPIRVRRSASRGVFRGIRPAGATGDRGAQVATVEGGEPSERPRDELLHTLAHHIYFGHGGGRY